jgi:hypothetical protein
MTAHTSSSASTCTLPHIDKSTNQEWGLNGPRMYRLQMMEGITHEKVAAIFIAMIMIMMMMILWILLNLFRSLSLFSFSSFFPRMSLRHSSFRLHWKKEVWFSFQVHSRAIVICLDRFYFRSNISNSISSQVPFAVRCSSMEILKSITSLFRSFILSEPNLNSLSLLPSTVIQGDQKVSVQLMITIEKVRINVQSVPRQSPDIYWHTYLTVFSMIVFITASHLLSLIPTTFSW